MSDLTLAEQWKERVKLQAEGGKLRAEGAKLRPEGDKLYAEGDKLRADGDILWAEAIIERFGNIEIKWVLRNRGRDCHLESGEIYKHDEAYDDE